MIRRHSRSAILMHWFNAFCWLVLLGSGFALLSNPGMQPVGAWWPRLWAGSAAGGRLLDTHLIMGLAWIAGSLLYVSLRLRREVVPFLAEILRLSPASDLTWCLRKGLLLVLGEWTMRRLGLGTGLPPQGFYNAGQKLAAIAAVGAGLGLAASGIVLALARGLRDAEGLVQWALFLHLCCAGLMAVVLPVHIYMASLAPGEGPALRSMFTGFVPESFARRHNPLWRFHRGDGANELP